MSNVISLSNLLENISAYGKLTTNDTIGIYDAYNSNSPSYVIYVTYNEIGAANKSVPFTMYIHKIDGIITYTTTNSLSIPSELGDYIEQIKDYRVSFDLSTLVPETYDDETDNNSIIIYTHIDTGKYTVSVYDNNMNKKFDVDNEEPFERLIHGKPKDSAEIFKTIARRLISAGFSLVHDTVMVDSHEITRIYTYRDIYITFYRDSAIYVGFSVGGNIPTTWQSFTTITEDMLDTSIYTYLQTNWYSQ